MTNLRDETNALPEIRIERREEDQLSTSEITQLAALLDACFPDTFNGRVYFKQLPNSRFLAWQGNEICGQIGLSHRMMRLGQRPVRVFGVIDLCVSNQQRRTGIGGKLLDTLIDTARQAGADMVLLFADDPRLYAARGFALRPNRCRWLALDDHRSLGVKFEALEDCMMSLVLGDIDWPDKAELDMLGYLY
ncbi:MAG: GNAT family N-acetyltransferase [Pseudomonadota bacterium]